MSWDKWAGMVIHCQFPGCERELKTEEERGSRFAVCAEHDPVKLRAAIEEARVAYRQMYDCEDDASPADLVRRALESEKHEHDRFKARGGELDRLDSEVQRLARALEAADKRALKLERDLANEIVRHAETLDAYTEKCRELTEKVRKGP